ncbi:hypothetical protein N8I87_28670 [Streptomyces sp. HUAS TT20]|nr:hypothetical protein N8I87_28670 [Streptomyces sp. HUAS 15-9]
MPFAMEEIRFDTWCRREPSGRWSDSIGLSIDARALWRLGLHPDQPSSVVVNGPSPPAWWHAAGERYALRREPVVKRHAS